MMIKVRCSCRKTFTIDTARFARGLRCPNCKKEIHLPIPSPATPKTPSPRRSSGTHRAPADLVEATGGRSAFGIMNLLIGVTGTLLAPVGLVQLAATGRPLLDAVGPFAIFVLAIGWMGAGASAFSMAASGVSALRCRAAATRRWSSIAFGLAALTVGGAAGGYTVFAVVQLARFSAAAAAIAVGITLFSASIALAWPAAQYLLATRSLFPAPASPITRRRAGRISSPRLAPAGSRLATR